MNYIQKILAIWLSPYSILFLLFFCIMLTISGTLIQIQLGMYATEKIIFDSWFYLANDILPVPGFKTLGTLIFVNLLSRFFFHIKKWLCNPSQLLIHLSIVIFILSGIVNSFHRKEFSVTLFEGETASLKETMDFPIPTWLKLHDFTIDFWPGTYKPRDYISDITVYTSSMSERAKISMNKPYRFQDYTIYQASFLEQNGKTGSGLHIVKSKFGFLPFLGMIFLFSGIIVFVFSHIRNSLFKKKHQLPSVLLLFTIVIIPYKSVFAEKNVPAIDISRLGDMVVVYDDRMMTIKTLAKHKLFLYTGRKFSEDSATQWFGDIVFNPEKSISQSIFYVKKDPLTNYKKIQDTRYSFRELYPLMYNYHTFTDKKNSTTDLSAHHELTRLSDNCKDFLTLLNTFSYLNRADNSKITTEEKMSSPLKTLFPVMVTSDSLSLMRLGNQLSALSSAYHHKRSDLFNCSIDSILDLEKTLITATLWKKVHLESWYYRLDLRTVAMFCFCIAIVAGIVRSVKIAVLSFIYIVPYSIGSVFLLLLLLFRTILLHRPPVVSIYETFIVVAFFFSIAGMFFWVQKREYLILLFSSIVSFIFLLLSAYFGNDFESMSNPAPVLNSNFWLSIHIITIIAGYAAFLAVCIAGHISLANYYLGRIIVKIPSNFLYQLLILAVVITAMGTVLGGLWADVSWGRFWGWDPKENGALLLIVWGAFLLHGYKSRILSDITLAWGAVGCGSAVLYTWIGVNLLGKGLHSYGFTTTGINVLVVFVIFEFVFISGLLVFGALRKRLKTDSCSRDTI